MKAQKPPCVVCHVNPRLHRSDHCRGCRDVQRKAYWRQRYAAKDFTEAQIEARYIRAVWQHNPAKALKLWQAWKAAA